MMTIAKWRSMPVVIALLLAQSSDTKTERTPLERLQAKIDVVSVPNLTPSQLAGQYTNPSEELSKRVPRMGSATLFVFPDRSYIFTFVTDVPPDTISDKGTWSLNGDTLELQSAKDVTWKSKHVERQHLVVRRRGHNDELFLMGMGWRLSYFEEHAKNDPEFQFLLDSLKREKAITAEETGPLRKRLMKEKWLPNFYRSESTLINRYRKSGFDSKQHASYADFVGPLEQNAIGCVS
jgi:hypothetical protein